MRRNDCACWISGMKLCLCETVLFDMIPVEVVVQGAAPPLKPTLRTLSNLFVFLLFMRASCVVTVVIRQRSICIEEELGEPNAQGLGIKVMAQDVLEIQHVCRHHLFLTPMFTHMAQELLEKGSSFLSRLSPERFSRFPQRGVSKSKAIGFSTDINIWGRGRHLRDGVTPAAIALLRIAINFFAVGIQTWQRMCVGWLSLLVD